LGEAHESGVLGVVLSDSRELDEIGDFSECGALSGTHRLFVLVDFHEVDVLSLLKVRAVFWLMVLFCPVAVFWLMAILSLLVVVWLTVVF